MLVSRENWWQCLKNELSSVTKRQSFEHVSMKFERQAKTRI